MALGAKDGASCNVGIAARAALTSGLFGSGFAGLGNTDLFICDAGLSDEQGGNDITFSETEIGSFNAF